MERRNRAEEQPERVRWSRLPAWLERALLPQDLPLPAAERHAALTTILFSLSMMLWGLVFIPIHVALGGTVSPLVLVLACVACTANAAALRFHRSVVLAGNGIAAIVLATLLALAVFTGGFRSPALLWLPSVPMLAMLVAGWRTGLAWFLATASSAWAVFLLHRQGALPASEIGDAGLVWLYNLSLVGIIACITLLCFLFDAVASALRRRLEAARKSAVDASHAKSAFLARMSHEIRTPMNGVLGMLELLGNTEISGRQREYTRFARQSAESLLRILNDILDFSKIEVGRLEIESIPFDLREVVGDTLQSLAADAEAKGLELACHIHPDVPSGLQGDPGRLRQILVNLVGNAIKFTEEGEVVVTITREAREGGHVRLAFRVRDTGIGIPVDKQRQIWDVFGQADTSTTRRFGGTGLGLNICRQLVRMMGGRLEFESTEGAGTTFTFALEYALLGPVLQHDVTPDASLSGVRVLVVDDNATNRFVLEEVLTGWNMDVTCVEGAESALAALREALATEAPYQLVLLDVMMPDTDGLMLARRIREEKSLDGLPLVILSSAHSAESRARCEALGIVGQLRKPVKQSELLDAVLLALHPEQRRRRETRPDPAARTAARPVRILLAEDGLVNRQVALGLLEEVGHHVTVVENGAEALAAWQQDRFDLILMDLEMPEMDGLEATRRIRAAEAEHDTGRRIPIIALTAHAIRDYEDRCREAGMDAHLAKPLDPKRLYDVIEAWTA